MNRCSPFKKSWMNQGLKTIAWTLCISGISSVCSVEPNPPTPWLSNPTPDVNGIYPSGVYIFDDSQVTTVNVVAASLFQVNGGQTPPSNGQFSDKRYALLFKPGSYYSLFVNVGYYTSVSGLGTEPGQTMLQDVRCPEGANSVAVGALNTFWRSAENFLTKPTITPWLPGNNGGTAAMVWATSQASGLRRVHVWANPDSVTKELPGGVGAFLFQLPANSGDAGYSSGGFMADCKFFNPDGTSTSQVESGSQQQYCVRNVEMSSWSNIVWNGVFIGCKGAPATTDPSNGGALINNASPGAAPPPFGNPYTTVEKTPVIAEKPFISFSGGLYYLNIPPIETNKVGNTTFPQTGVVQVPFDSVYVATSVDSAAVINGKIASGLHVVFSPGIYQLDAKIYVNNSNICLLGLGLATLLPPSNGDPCIEVGNVDGVRIAGLLLQADTPPTSSTPTFALLKWGAMGYAGNAANPGFLYDCYARVGGPADSAQTQVEAKMMVQINSGNVVCDNVWLWRADHDMAGFVKNGDNPCDTGIEINGDHVTTYGLAAEHTLKDMTIWNGNYGQVYFYQAEYPYDVTSNYATQGYVGYKLGPNVTDHIGYGIGIYSFFKDHEVTMATAISTPAGNLPNIKFTNALTRFLGAKGGITHVINAVGQPVSAQGNGPSYVHQYPSSSNPNNDPGRGGRGAR